jgi:hypothetical protein
MMMMSKLFMACVATALVSTGSLSAKQPRRVEQDRALDATQRGEIMPLRSIENNIVPSMKASGADYIGQEFNDEENRYRLKFMRGKSVIWVDVDGRTGAIVGQAGG